MLYLIGLGLIDENDMSLRGLDTLRECDEVYAELYTGVFRGSISNIEKLSGKTISVLSRKDLEEDSDDNVFMNAKDKKVALLVPGDPLVATTHISLLTEAWKRKIEIQVIHSSSIYSAVSETGLQLYKFGKTTTLAFPEEGYYPTSPYDVLGENQKNGLHTLVLLDVKADDGRYMALREGIELLLEMESKKQADLFNEETTCVGVARLGHEPTIKVGSAKALMEADFGQPPHSLIVPGRLHFVEEEALMMYGLKA